MTAVRIELCDSYPATFEDDRGREVTRIHNDGKELRVTLRGVDFTGDDFDSFSPVAEQVDVARERFTLRYEHLSSCRLEWTMPLVMELGGTQQEAPLKVTLTLGAPMPNGSLASEALVLELLTPAGPLRSSGRWGWFEDELLDLVRQLGEGESIRACITCAWSDYSPYGHGLFGGLACFRDAKEDYAKVEDKEGLFRVWDLMTDFVQETYLCEAYGRRAPGAGYRG